MNAVWTLATLAVAGYGFAGAVWQLMVACLLFNALETAGTIVWATIKQRHVPPTMLGRVAKRQPVRIITWDGDRDRALDLAELAHAFAASHVGGGVRSVLPDVPVYIDADPDTGEPMAAATVIANLAPIDVPIP